MNESGTKEIRNDWALKVANELIAHPNTIPVAAKPRTSQSRMRIQVWLAEARGGLGRGLLLHPSLERHTPRKEERNIHEKLNDGIGQEQQHQAPSAQSFIEAYQKQDPAGHDPQSDKPEERDRGIRKQDPKKRRAIPVTARGRRSDHQRSS